MDAAALALSLFAFVPQGTPRTLDPNYHHLGNDVTEDWSEASAEPEGGHYQLSFRSLSNTKEWVLSLHQRDVDDPWALRLNGEQFGQLRRSDERFVAYYRIPARMIVPGVNVLRIDSENGTDDMTIGDIRIHESTLRELFDLHPVTVRVKDEATAAGLPVRLTITDPAGELVETYYAQTARTAVRTGVVYTMDGEARFELPVGAYRIHALRGTEWSHALAEIEVGETRETEVDLVLRREVATPGLVAADTHLHTYTFSGHGDATVEERLVSLAGEGVELAIATDHNHHTDYRPLQRTLELDAHFTVVTGNEVTTDNGHFNAFPLDPATAPPEHEIEDWVRLVEGIREAGARVVILNHPRWPSLEKGPLGVFDFDRVSGERHAGPRFTFDAMELVNSTALLEDRDYLFQDWFALLNHGERIAAVGSSDSHTVGDPPGQGRTYVPSSSDDPSRIDIDEVCAAFLRGDVSVSLGIVCEIRVGEAGRAGDTLAVEGQRIDVVLRVAAPSWVRPHTARLYLNGAVVQERELPGEGSEPTDVDLTFALERPPHDAWLVAAVFGDGIEDPCWRTRFDYTLAASNPVWLDVDGDGRYQSPRELARAIVAASPTDGALRTASAACDRAVATQMLVELRARGASAERLKAVAGDPADPANAPLWRYLETTAR